MMWLHTCVPTVLRHCFASTCGGSYLVKCVSVLQLQRRLSSSTVFHPFVALIEDDGAGGLQGVDLMVAAVDCLRGLWPQQDGGRLRATAKFPPLLPPQAQVTLAVCEGNGSKPVFVAVLKLINKK